MAGESGEIFVSGTFTPLGAGWIKASLTFRIDGAETTVESDGVGREEAKQAAFSKAIDQLGISTISTTEELEEHLNEASLQALEDQPPEPRHGL